MQQELVAARRPHAGYEVGPSVLDTLVLGLQQLDCLAVDAEQMPGQVRGQALEGIPADDVFGNHAQRLTRGARVRDPPDDAAATTAPQSGPAAPARREG